MNFLRPKIASSDLVSNAAKLFSANVLAQAIGLLIYPALTRMYAPEDFGLMNLFLSIGGVLVLLTTMEYYNAIVLPQSEREGVAMAHVGLCGVAVVCLLTILSVLFSGPIANAFKTPELADWYWLMPVYVFTMGCWNVLNYWYIRRNEYSRIQGFQVSQSLLSAGTKLGLGTAGCLRGGLILGTVLAPFASLAVSLGLAWKKHLQPLLHVDMHACRKVAVTYRNFPIYSLPRTFVNMLAGQLPVFVLTPIFGTAELGFWTMAVLLAFSPISMVTRALYQSLYQFTVERVNANLPIRPFFRRFTKLSMMAVVPAFAMLYIILPSLTAWLLGEDWRLTGEYIRWMLPWLACNVLTASTGFLADIFFKQKIGLLFELLMAVLRLAGVAIGAWQGSFLLAIAGYSVGSAIAVLAQYIWLMTLVRTYDRQRIA